MPEPAIGSTFAAGGLAGYTPGNDVLAWTSSENALYLLQLEGLPGMLRAGLVSGRRTEIPGPQFRA